MELQQWAAWRHQQTMENLVKIKEDAEARQMEECTFAPVVPTNQKNATKSTVTKLMNRRRRNQMAATAGPQAGAVGPGAGGAQQAGAQRGAGGTQGGRMMVGDVMQMPPSPNHGQQQMGGEQMNFSQLFEVDGHRAGPGEMTPSSVMPGSTRQGVPGTAPPQSTRDPYNSKPYMVGGPDQLNADGSRHRNSHQPSGTVAGLAYNGVYMQQPPPPPPEPSDPYSNARPETGSSQNDHRGADAGADPRGHGYGGGQNAEQTHTTQDALQQLASLNDPQRQQAQQHGMQPHDSQHGQRQQGMYRDETGAPSAPPNMPVTGEEHDTLIDAFKNEIDSLTAERDSLLSEKRHWLEQLKTENALLMVLLQDARAAKEKLLQELDAVEREKDKIRAREMDEMDSKFDEILSNTPLGEQNRSQLQANIRSRADEVHKALCMLAIRCHANHRDLMRHVLEKVHVAEQAFLNGDDVGALSDELRAIASSRPNNVEAAKTVARDVTTAVIAAAVDVENMPDVDPRALRREKSASATGGVVESKAGGSGAESGAGGESAPPVNVAEMHKIRGEYAAQLSAAMAARKAAEKLVDKLTAKNEALKSNLSGLRRKHAQMKVKEAVSSGAHVDASQVAAAAAEDSTSQIPVDPSALRAFKSNTFDELPSTMRVAAWRALMEHTKQAASAHPLASAVPSPIRKEVAREAALELRDLVGQVLWTTATGARGKNQSVETLVSRALSSGPVQSELTPVLTMLMTYVMTRGEGASGVAGAARADAGASEAPNAGGGTGASGSSGGAPIVRPSDGDDSVRGSVSARLSGRGTETSARASEEQRHAMQLLQGYQRPTMSQQASQRPSERGSQRGSMQEGVPDFMRASSIGGGAP